MTEDQGQQWFEQAEDAERTGDPAVARELYERLLHSLGSGADFCPSETLRRIARCHHQSNDFLAAQDVLVAALAAAKALGTPTAEALVLNTQAAVAQTLGDPGVAEQLYNQARDRARGGGEHVIVAMVDQNLGTLANTRGYFEEALRRYAQALGAYDVLNMPERRSPLLANIGRLHTDLGAWSAAEASFEEALTCAGEAGDRVTELLVQVNVTRMELAREAYAKAANSVLRSRELAQELGDTRWTGLIAKQQAVIHREIGDLVNAVHSLKEARLVAEQSGDRLLEAEVARELAQTHWRAKHNRDTLLWLNRAHRLFEELQARHEAADIGARAQALEELFFDIVREWGSSIESKDACTHGHSERVTRYALMLADAAGIDPRERNWFEMGALLHDVGKVAIPDAILQKPGPLTADEWVVMRGHSAKGESLLADVEFPWDIALMVRHHHEAWDGGGYPDNLKGEAIPWTARVLCVADVYDALTTERPYRGAYNRAQAVEIMDEMSGSRLDPELYRIFRRLLAEGGVTAPREAGLNKARSRLAAPN